MISMLQLLLEATAQVTVESGTSDEAKRLGLVSLGGPYYGKPTGEITHKAVLGKLVPHDVKTQGGPPTPAAKPAAPAPKPAGAKRGPKPKPKVEPFDAKQYSVQKQNQLKGIAAEPANQEKRLKAIDAYPQTKKAIKQDSPQNYDWQHQLMAQGDEDWFTDSMNRVTASAPFKPVPPQWGQESVNYPDLALRKGKVFNIGAFANTMRASPTPVIMYRDKAPKGARAMMPVIYPPDNVRFTMEDELRLQMNSAKPWADAGWNVDLFHDPAVGPSGGMQMLLTKTEDIE